MLKIGITGNIAAGKSKVEEFLKTKGFQVLDADEVAHSLLKDEKIKKQIITTFFGFDILEEGEVSRQKLGRVVFSNEICRKKLEEILHPRVKLEIVRFFRFQHEKGENVAFVSVPLLFEAEYQDVFDKIVLIYADDEVRLNRLMKRNDLSLEHAQQRLEMQISQDKKVSLADCVIYNNKTIEDLFKNSEEIFKLF